MKRLSLILLALPALAAADLNYQLKPDLAAKSVRVAVQLDEADDKVEMRIPAWCPGFYFILDYQKKISKVKATDEAGKPLEVVRKDERGWAVSNPRKGPITFSYSVLGDDPGLGFFGVNVRDHTVFTNGAATFMYPAGRLEEKVNLKLVLPENWRVATAMTKASDGAYTAGGYDELIDHPLQMGAFEVRKFVVGGVPFEAVYVSTDKAYAANLDEETERLRKLSIPAVKLFGTIPFKKFVYIVHLSVGNFGGGLEHRASTVFATPNSKPLGIDTLATHEYLHAWNVKQIRPKVLGPFDYTQRVRTKNLWFAEGVTDYYAQIHAYQSGLEDENFLIRQLGMEINSLQGSKIRLQKTLEEACYETWDNGGFGYGDLSYYTKGLVAGLILDAAIRSQTEGEKSLDDVMRLLYKRHALPKPGFEETGILATINEVAGADLSDVYRRTVQSVEEVPYEVLRGIGLEVQQRQGGGFGLRKDPNASAAAKARLAEWLKR
jgi:predicted metalloprotease with PDZ domain